uniref:Uncharacterized protein n=1 Tax=Romanomermis culicivorax TaxID=13658 RepID=A0A915JN87_ROMCU
MYTAGLKSLKTEHLPKWHHFYRIFVNNSASRISINSVWPPSFDPSVDDLIDILSNNNNNPQQNGPNLDNEGTINNDARYAAECDLLQRRVISSNDPISEQSLCPWSWIVDVKPRRIPGTIFKAKCRCEWVAPKVRPSPLTSNYECETVNMEIKVIEYEEKDATCTHPIEKLESVPVACVAIINRIYHVGRGSSANVEMPNIEI